MSIATDGAWVGLALALEAGSMVTFARLQRGVLASAGLRLSMPSALAIVLAGNAVSVTVPVAGTTASAAFTHREYVQRGASAAMAGWAMVVAGVFSTVTLAALVGAGALANANGVAAAAGIVSIVLAIAPVLAFAVAMRSARARRHIERVAIAALRFVQRVTRRPRGDLPALVSDGVSQLVTYRMRRRAFVASTGWAALNWVLDACCLWAVLQAFDASVSLRDLVLVYSAGAAAASLSLTPAGVGTVEAAIALVLAGFGADGGHAMAAAIAYRAISTWLVAMVGWTTLVTLRRRSPAAVAVDAAVTPARDASRPADRGVNRSRGRGCPRRQPEHARSGAIRPAQRTSVATVRRKTSVRE